MHDEITQQNRAKVLPPHIVKLIAEKFSIDVA